MADVIVVIVGVALVVITIAVLWRQGSAGRLSDEESTPGPRPPRGEVVGRPGGPGTEATGVAGPGEPAPDPQLPPEEEGP